MNNILTPLAFLAGFLLGIGICLMPASCSPDALPAGEVHLMRL